MRHEKTKRRDAEAAKLRVRGRTYLQIADELGYASPGGAHDAVSRSLAESVRTPFEQQRELALNQLDQLASEAWNIVQARHCVVSAGKVMSFKGKPITVEELTESSFKGVDIAHTAVGYVTHHPATLFWAVVFERWIGGRRPLPALSLFQRALATSAVAAVVDYAATPKRLTPGWELVLTKRSMAVAYGAMAVGLTLGAVTRRSR